MSRIPPRDVPKPPPIPGATSTASSFITRLVCDDYQPEPSAEPAPSSPVQDSDWVVSSLQTCQIIIFVFDFILLLGSFWPFLMEDFEFGTKAAIFIGNILSLVMIYLFSRAAAATMQVLIELHQDRK